MQELAQFKRVFRNYQSILEHKQKPVWIVAYREYDTGRVKFWQAYKVKEYLHVPKGRAPWSIDNRRIGTDKGFRTLRDAIMAAVAAL